MAPIVIQVSQRVANNGHCLCGWPTTVSNLALYLPLRQRGDFSEKRKTLITSFLTRGCAGISWLWGLIRGAFFDDERPGKAAFSGLVHEMFWLCSP